ncbi:MAG TPA: chitobiase/beta-hexosaminidase C-terminal domain-containing protein [Acidobacteriaceae bacterium]|nr:chitobiase/beta-hexosaminidase C-terminal domain-containing protein [Acidobacteriaceae bacterium]
MKTTVLALFLAASPVLAQDPGMMAAQTQQNMASDANAQIQSMLQLSAVTQAAMTQLAMTQEILTQQQTVTWDAGISNSALHIPPWSAWKVDSSNYLNLSVKPGTVKPGTQVRIKWRGGEYAGVYYTLDGWSPSPASTPYTGPITINGPVHLQAIALDSGWTRTPILDAEYNVTSTVNPSPEKPAVATGGFLRAGTVLKLKTAAEVTSNAAKQGDKVPLVLDQDVTVSGAIVIPKGTPVDAVLTQVAPSKGPHHPAMLVVAVRSIQNAVTPVKLLGIETMQGAAGQSSGEAVIEPGMIVDAKVAVDTKLLR